MHCWARVAAARVFLADIGQSCRMKPLDAQLHTRVMTHTPTRTDIERPYRAPRETTPTRVASEQRNDCIRRDTLILHESAHLIRCDVPGLDERLALLSLLRIRPAVGGWYLGTAHAEVHVQVDTDARDRPFTERLLESRVTVVANGPLAVRNGSTQKRLVVVPLRVLSIGNSFVVRDATDAAFVWKYRADRHGRNL